MDPRQAALEVNGVRLADGAVGGELDGRALDERTGRHDDLAVIAGHVPGQGGHIAVHRRCSLDTAAEGEHGLLAAQLDGLDDVVPGLGGVGHAPEAQALVDVGGKDRALERTGRDRRGEEEALVQRGHQAEIRADLLSEARRGETVRAALYARRGAADVAANGGEAAAGILDQRADDHVRTDIAGLDGLHELAVAVVHHADDVAADGLDERDQLADLRDGERRAGGVALGALDGDQLRLRLDLFADALVVEAAVRQQIDLVVGHAVFAQGALALADADDLLERVVRAADGGEQLVARQQVGAQRDGQRMRAAGDLRAHERGLGVEGVGIDALKRIAADVVVAVAGGAHEAAGVHTVLLHGKKHLVLIVFGDLVDRVKARTQDGENLLAQREDLFAHAQPGIHLFVVHLMTFPLRTQKAGRHLRFSNERSIAERSARVKRGRGDGSVCGRNFAKTVDSFRNLLYNTFRA